MIYFIQESDTCNIKIGHTATDDPGVRQRPFQTGNSQRLVLLGTMPGGEDVERDLHARFAGSRVAGEWFRPTPELFLLIQNNCVANRERMDFRTIGTVVCPYCGEVQVGPLGAFSRVGTAYVCLEQNRHLGTEYAGVAQSQEGALACLFMCRMGCRFAVVFLHGWGGSSVQLERLPDRSLFHNHPDPFDDILLKWRHEAQSRLLQLKRDWYSDDAEEEKAESQEARQA